MRIIAGTFRSRTLKSPKGRSCRPAMARTREALFSMLEARGLVWSQTRVLDIFAGSGSLSFEALSRGALCATLCEHDPESAKCIRANAALLGVVEKVSVLEEDAIRVLRRGTSAAYQLAFIDPPYRKAYAQAALSLLAGGWLADGALVACEVESTLTLEVPPFFTSLLERCFGQTKVCLLRYCPASSGGERDQNVFS